jgi:hypothetical protein
MKKMFFTAIAVVSLYACKSSDKKTGGNGADTSKIARMSKEEIAKAGADTANYTTIQWLDSTILNLGKIPGGVETEVSFRFKNAGTTNLIIENVTAACGCTIPEKPEQPFAPGQEGVIKAKYNGSGSGQISKTVTVIANTKPVKESILTFTGEVVEKK